MDKCMTMPGGGPFMLYGGQVTDDSELAMCLMHGLLDNEQNIQLKNTLNMNLIAKRYKDWMNSPPFDIGTTTRGGFEVLKNSQEPTQE